jgi:hypothetical protein
MTGRFVLSPTGSLHRYLFSVLPSVLFHLQRSASAVAEKLLKIAHAAFEWKAEEELWNSTLKQRYLA